MKSLAFDFVGLAAAILEDVAATYPDDQLEWDRDKTRLTHLVETRGISVFTMDLPLIRKHFDRCLADGCLVRAHLPHMGRRHSGSPVPRLFWGLWSRVFDYAGCLKRDIDPNAVLFLRTLLDVGKNFEMDCAPKYLFEATKEFFDVENNLAPPSQFWDDGGTSSYDHPRSKDPGDSSYGKRSYSSPSFGLPARFAAGFFECEDPRVVSVLQYVQRHADRIVGFLGEYNAEEWRFRHGPGAVSDRKKGEYKYNFLRWGKRLEDVYPIDSFGLTGLGLMDKLDEHGIGVLFEEGASKLIAVPKTARGPRLIASEPSYHMWAQQNVRDFLYTRVESTVLGKSIHFRDQRYNQAAALSGSIDGGRATIDLKSASDRISCWLVEDLFRKNNHLLEAFSRVRTRWIWQSLDREFPALHKLRKFSTMGSALTFPVQSLVFLAIACGVGNYIHPSWSMAKVQREVLVFGDDIVVPNHWTEALAAVLELLGLKVNHAKTFSGGNFRESCGMDAWMGSDVTPPHVTLKPLESNPKSIASCVAVSNNFYKKGFWHAADWLRQAIGMDNIPVTAIDSGTFGFTSFSKGWKPRKIRWNPNLHFWEGLCTSIFAVADTIKQDSASAILQYFTEEPKPYVKYSSGVVIAGKPVIRRRWVPLHDLAF